MEHSDLNLFADAQSLGFSVALDEVSVRVTHPDDRFFFVRIEFVDAELVVSDFNSSNFGPWDMSVALAFALDTIGSKYISRLRFRDLALSSSERTKDFRTTLGYFAKRSGYFLVSLDLSERNHKPEVLARFTS